MRHKTLSQLVSGVQDLMSQVSGQSTQLYSEDVIAAHIQTAFDYVQLLPQEWPSLYTWETRTLNGTTGVVTSDFTHIRNFLDVIRVYPSDSDYPLSLVPTSLNPNRLTGTYPRFHGPYIDTSTSNRLLTIYPITSTGNINVFGRIHYDTFGSTDTVPFDSVCLEQYAAWCYCVIDGVNMGQAELHRQAFDVRIKQLEHQLARPIQLAPLESTYLTQWTENTP